jgi:hypothetical protein
MGEVREDHGGFSRSIAAGPAPTRSIALPGDRCGNTATGQGDQRCGTAIVGGCSRAVAGRNSCRRLRARRRAGSIRYSIGGSPGAKRED